MFRGSSPLLASVLLHLPSAIGSYFSENGGSTWKFIDLPPHKKYGPTDVDTFNLIMAPMVNADPFLPILTNNPPLFVTHYPNSNPCDLKTWWPLSVANTTGLIGFTSMLFWFNCGIYPRHFNYYRSFEQVGFAAFIMWEPIGASTSANVVSDQYSTTVITIPVLKSGSEPYLLGAAIHNMQDPTFRALLNVSRDRTIVDYGLQHPASLVFFRLYGVCSLCIVLLSLHTMYLMRKRCGWPSVILFGEGVLACTCRAVQNFMDPIFYNGNTSHEIGQWMLAAHQIPSTCTTLIVAFVWIKQSLPGHLPVLKLACLTFWCGV